MTIKLKLLFPKPFFLAHQEVSLSASPGYHGKSVGKSPGEPPPHPYGMTLEDLPRFFSDPCLTFLQVHYHFLVPDQILLETLHLLLQLLNFPLQTPNLWGDMYATLIGLQLGDYLVLYMSQVLNHTSNDHLLAGKMYQGRNIKKHML